MQCGMLIWKESGTGRSWYKTAPCFGGRSKTLTCFRRRRNSLRVTEQTVMQPLESLEIAKRRHHRQMSLSQSFLSCCVELSNKSVPITARGVWPAPRADQKRLWQGGLTWSRVFWALLLLLERRQCEGLGHVKEVVVRSWIFSTICNWSRLTCFSTDAEYGEWFVDGA